MSIDDLKMSELKTLLTIANDNFDKDDFYKGLHDGLELAIALLEDRGPNCRVYKEKKEIE